MREYSIHNLHCVCVYDILKEKKSVRFLTEICLNKLIKNKI